MKCHCYITSSNNLIQNDQVFKFTFMFILQQVQIERRSDANAPRDFLLTPGHILMIIQLSFHTVLPCPSIKST